MKVGLVWATEAGRRAAVRLAEAFPTDDGGGCTVHSGPVREQIAAAWQESDAIVAFLATGATVRLVAPLLTDKYTDPGVVCVDETGRYAVALLGGHAGGANVLAARVAETLGAQPIVTTGTDSAGIPGLDTLGFRVANPDRLAAVSRALLDGVPIALRSDQTWPLPALPDNVGTFPDAQYTVHITDRLLPPDTPTDQAEGRAALGDGRAALSDGSAGSGVGGGRAVLGDGGAVLGAGDAGTAAGRVTAGRGALVLRPPSLVLGIGGSRGVSSAEIGELVDRVLAEAGLSADSVCRIATADIKADEAGLVEFAAERGWPIVTFTAAQLSAVDVPNPSEVVRAAVGTPSVSEAAALLGAALPPDRGEPLRDGTALQLACSEPLRDGTALQQDPSEPLRDGVARDGGEQAPGASVAALPGRAQLVVEKVASAMATVAVARVRARGRLAIVGLGPGAADLRTPRATAELRAASIVVGLDQYVDQIAHLLRPGTRIVASGLGAEEERARSAVELAQAGHAVALIGSGDAGVYAMASPALEFASDDIDAVAVPGVTAALAASSLLGAPLGHDHVYISLSDLHTPWEMIEKRLQAAAETDLVVCLYNPRSRRRTSQLPDALRILGKHRPMQTPIGLVHDASRAGQWVATTTIGEIDVADVDMNTVVIVGSSTTRLIAGRMVTPRGYAWMPA